MRDFEEITPTPLPVTTDVPVDTLMKIVVPEEQEKQVRRSRGLLTKAVIPFTVIAAYLTGPCFIDTAVENQRAKAREALASVANAEKPTPVALQMAHYTVAREMFGGEGDAITQGNHLAQSAAKNLNEHKFKTPGAWRLPAEQFVDPEKIEISDDGRSFRLNGTEFSLTHGADEDGNAYILAGQTETAENGQIHMKAPQLVGASKKAEGLTPAELRGQASEDAKEKLRKFLSGTELAQHNFESAAVVMR